MTPCNELKLGRRRTVAAITLCALGNESYVSSDGVFWFAREDPYRPHRGWWVRALIGEYADPHGAWEPLTDDYGISHFDTLREAVLFAYNKCRWEWRRQGLLRDEDVERSRRDPLAAFNAPLPGSDR